MSGYRTLRHIYDGDQGPVYDFVPDLGTNFDANHAAIAFYIQDASGTTLATRPGVVISPKTDKHFHLLMKGKETDWDGLGKDLYVVMRTLIAQAPDRTPATNLLLNPSFDTYSATVAVASCTTTSGNRKVTSSAAFGNVYAGMTVTGTGIPGGTFVDAVLNTSTIFLSAAATGSATVTLTFGRFGVADSWNVAGGSLVISCTTNGTTALTSSSAFGAVSAGQKIYGDFIPDGTTVLSKTDNSNLTLSAAATGSSTVNRVFQRIGYGLGNITYAVGADDPAPPAIFGSRQSLYATTVQGTDQGAYLNQNVTISGVAGDYFSAGAWVRAHADSGASVAGSAGSEGYRLELNCGESTAVRNFFVSTPAFDWQFVKLEQRITATRTSGGLSLLNYDALGYQLRVDDAFMFKGRWSDNHVETFRLPVLARSRPSKTNFGFTNFIAGWGGFETDSNGDGVADCWGKTGTLTYSIESDPDDVGTVFGGKFAQKVVLAGSTNDSLVIVRRGKFLAGQTWRFAVYYKNSGAVSGSPANGDFGIILQSEEFDGTFDQSSLAGSNFALTSTAAYIQKSRTLTLTADHSALVCKINLKTATGATLWLDDASLTRTS